MDAENDPRLQNLQIACTVSDTPSVQMGYSLDGDVSMTSSSQADVGSAGPSEVMMDWVKQ
jgi:hypothetical protein